MSVKDVIKNSVFESIGVGNGLTIRTVLLILIMACLAGIYIFMVYKLSAKSAFYSKDLNITMAGMPVIVAAIMIAMQSNLLVSLGMVGALSIVRFRNAVKNPVDLLYLFWSISTGIIVGVGLHILGIILCVIMTILLFMLNMIPNVKAPELLVLRSIEKEMNYEELYEIIRGNCKYFKEKARTVKNGESEIIIEISTKSKEKLLRELNDMGQLTQINCLSHDGECRI
ncbi:DUF4956 domain-containing protein [Parablautia intestinalis]|jgi:uncharacterized membrane protein YhiD involved in acid resistance|uniref:DUF4956 domain-containing protein n=1 Tax=Parablautia intestinalis TaxID=2320100 RepID=A0A3A9AZ83_9FIRM|nr:DUF4956 domain-containing protein [Parablautia intestinalis]MCI8616346.1 DUF4956 domain-containing protein [Lachnospiraceae bacterium]RKI92841.1 DUF4956 domain-containing protein [Parablautia intestinalis]